MSPIFLYPSQNWTNYALRAHICVLQFMFFCVVSAWVWIDVRDCVLDAVRVCFHSVWSVLLMCCVILTPFWDQICFDFCLLCPDRYAPMFCFLFLFEKSILWLWSSLHFGLHVYFLHPVPVWLFLRFPWFFLSCISDSIFEFRFISGFRLGTIFRELGSILAPLLRTLGAFL